jgi:DNA-binding winged helix-turn-helix (wHTH) protein
MQNPYEASYKLACEKLAALDLDEVAFNSSARMDNGVLSLELLGEPFIIKERGKDITASSGQEPRISEKILLLHYLVTADGSPLSREEVTLENIPGAAFYYPTYKARSIDLIVRRFAAAPNDFIKAVQKIGFNLTREGRQYRLKLLALPNVPISFVLWESDDSKEPAMETLKVLYDTGITRYLPLEDIIIITEMIAYRIIKSPTG